MPVLVEFLLRQAKNSKQPSPECAAWESGSWTHGPGRPLGGSFLKTDSSNSCSSSLEQGSLKVFFSFFFEMMAAVFFSLP